jgi:hypothetical protein
MSVLLPIADIDHLLLMSAFLIGWSGSSASDCIPPSCLDVARSEAIDVESYSRP